MRVIKIWLDDVRPAPDKTWWAVKCVNHAKIMIEAAEMIPDSKIILDLDHDLGDWAYNGGDGIKLLDWMVETGRFYPVELHTQNVVGRENMQRLIDRYWR